MKSEKTKTSSKPSAKKRDKASYTEEDIIALGEEFVEYCKTTDNCTISSFAATKGKTYAWWRYLIHEYKDLLLTYHVRGKELIGTRLLKENCTANPLWVLKTLVPHFLQEVKDANKEVRDEDYDYARKLEELKHEYKLKEEEHKQKLLTVAQESSGRNLDILQELINSMGNQ